MEGSDDKLRELVRGAWAGRPVPDFESSWRRAEARSRERRGSTEPSRWRWALGPAVAVGAAACAVLLVLAFGPSGDSPEDGRLLALADAGVSPGEASPLAGLETPRLPRSPLADLGDKAGDSVASADAEAGETRPGYGLFEAGTDFLLTMEIPAWDEAGERNVL